MLVHKTISSLKEEAKSSLTGKWIFAAGITLLFFVATMLTQIVPSQLFLIPFVIAPIFKYGYALVMLRLSRGEKVTFEMLFEGFSNRFGTIFFAGLVIIIRTILWSLLFIIPGIIAAYSYSQTFFILADNKDITALDSIEESKKIMKGSKWRFFLLSLSFIGWVILSLLTLGVGFFFLEPYCMVAYAKFYESITLKHKSHQE